VGRLKKNKNRRRDEEGKKKRNSVDLG